MKPVVSNASFVSHRHALHRWVHRPVLALAAIAVLGYVIPTHAVSGQAVHSDLADLGAGPLIALCAMLAIITWSVLRAPTRGTGYVIGFAAMAGPAFLVADIVHTLPHLFQTVETHAGAAVSIVGTVGSFFAGMIAIVCEIMVGRRERHAARAASATRAASASAS